MDKKFIGLVGSGYWGKNILRELYNIRALHTICDKDENLLQEHLEKYPSLNITTNWKKMLENPDITAVCIALPAVLHYQFALEALNNNKDVFVEKPLALSVEHCDELIKLAKEKNRILMVGHLLQYHPCVQKIYEMVNNNYIGNIKYIVSNRLNLGKIRREENVLWSFAPHDISIILKLMGDKMPTSVICNGHAFVSKNVHDITSTILEFGEEVYSQINVNWLNPFKEQKLVIVGTNGMITFDDTIEDKLKYFGGYMEWKKGQPVVTKNDGEVINYDKGVSPLFIEMHHFIDCCKKRVEPFTDGKEGKRVLSVLDMAQKSLTQNKKIYYSEKKIDYFVHETSIIDEGSEIGKGSKIWHFCHLVSSAKIGENCNLGQNIFLAGQIGNNCKVQNNVSIYKGVKAGDNVFFGPSCCTSNDLRPRCKYPKNGKYLETIIEDNVTIGANATIVCGVRLGKGCMVAAGSTVTRDISPYTLVAGTPAREMYKIDEYGERVLQLF